VRVGVATEIKPDEYRVALTPAGALELIRRGHEVVVESGAGIGSAFADGDYERVGARIASVDEIWGSSDLLLKVKEPECSQCAATRSRMTTGYASKTCSPASPATPA
jgi:alanine dehydrogenase